MYIQLSGLVDESRRADGGFPKSRFELYRLRGYIASATGRVSAQSKPLGVKEIAAWVDAHAEELGVRTLTASTRASNPEDRDAPADLRSFAAALLPKGPALPPSSLEKRLHWIAASLRLGSLDAAILGLCVRAALVPPLHSFAEVLGGSEKVEDEIAWRATGLLLGRPERAIRERLNNARPLMQLGLIEDRGGRDYAPSATVMRLARLARSDPKRLRAELIGHPPRASLAWEDFDHIGEARDFCAKLVGAALTRKEKGIGVLLYGVAGTGKTEFAKCLAQRLGATTVFIGETDEKNGEPSRSERVSHFALTSVLAAGMGRILLVVDEADDIFTGVDEGDRASRTGSKVFMNRLVESCAAPTVWITNSAERLGPAVLRRMTLAIGFREPGRDVRRRMVKRLAAKRNVKLDAQELDRLAAMSAPPALLDAGLRAAALTGGGSGVALTGAASLLTALNGTPPAPAPAKPFGFDPSLSAAACDLAALAERAEASFRSGETALSFCFYGLPGTGKSAYARFIAERLELEVLEKRASDLLSMWLGGTEQNIAAAFAEAAERKAMLVLDEADSLLRDRAGAQRSWEVSQVNELLTWMERHPHPFVCTTNAMESLDPATLRRFLFKVEFLPMNAAQGREAFARAFGAGAPASLDRVDPLTPGDFAVVARKAKVLGERDPEALVAMLAAEAAAKPEGRKARMGF